ncbi:MAG: hypothetical protein CM1200mP16_15630 [Nitrospina sp.]|nr:MAG: hypothetical protein CM1200mP16_15630 [Nitrospina sp.]
MGNGQKVTGTRHHKLILVSMVSMIIYFVGYYYARSLGVLSFEGREGFGGPDDVYENVFKPVLITHLSLVVVGMILAFYMLSQGFRASKIVGGEYFLKDGELKVSPRKFKIVMFSILGCWILVQITLLATRENPLREQVFPYALIFKTRWLWFLGFGKKADRKVIARWGKKTSSFGSGYHDNLCPNFDNQHGNLSHALLYLSSKNLIARPAKFGGRIETDLKA